MKVLLDDQGGTSNSSEEGRSPPPSRAHTPERCYLQDTHLLFQLAKLDWCFHTCWFCFPTAASSISTLSQTQHQLFCLNNIFILRYTNQKYGNSEFRHCGQCEAASHDSQRWQLCNTGLHLTFLCCCSQHQRGCCWRCCRAPGGCHGPREERRSFNTKRGP